MKKLVLSIPQYQKTTRQNKMLEELVEISNKVIEILKGEFGASFISLALFGSWARGEAREESDVDFFAIIENLPLSYFERALLLNRIIVPKIKRRVLLIGKTKREFTSNLPSLFLDLAQDGIILYDQDDYLKEKLELIKSYIKQAGLVRVKREDKYAWEWKVPPKKGWEITWEGFRELS